jgi:hypothetical protein
MYVFLVAYTCLNLNLKMFAETHSNRQQRYVSILRYTENTITKVR